MPQFSLPNITTGGSQTITANTLADAEAQAQSAGTWNPGAGTFGSNSIVGGGTTTPTGPGTPSSATDMTGLAAFAAQTSGVTQAQLAQQKAEFDAQLQFAKDQMQQLGIPQLQINQFLAQMQQEQFQSQLQLATQAQAYNQAATTAGLTGYYTPPSPVPDMSQYTNQNIWQPGQQGFGGGINQGSGALTWDKLSQMMKAASPNTYNDAAAKAMAFQMQGSQQGNLPLNLSQQQLDQIVATGTGGQVGSYSSLSGTPGAWTAGGTAGGTGGAYSWNQLSQQLQSQAGGNYNDAAGKAAFQQAIGANPASFNGSQSVNLSQDQLNAILSAGSNGQLGQTSAAPSGGAGATGGTGTGTDTTGIPTTGYATGTSTYNHALGLFQPPGTTTGGAGPGQPAGSQMTMQLGQLLGQYNGVPTEAAREFNANLGQQYLSTAAQLQGPQNTFQLSNYLRGAQGNPNVPVYLQNLANAVGTPSFQATGTNAPTLQSAAGIANQLGGGSSATPGWNYNQTLGTLQNIMQGGAQKLAPGSLEQLTPDELQAFGSGLGAVGGSLPSFMSQYAASRVGQQAPTAMTSLA